MEESPNVIVLAGPNGAGKSTISKRLIPGFLGIRHFVNADTIAHGLSAFHSESMAFKAGKIMLQHLHELAEERASFAFETTLASRTFAPWLRKLRGTGYLVHLFFVWVPSAEVSLARVEHRVRTGGHHVPDETVRRRYDRGLENFFRIYRPLADNWEFIDNSNPQEPKIIAKWDGTIEQVENQRLWTGIQERYAS